MGQFQHHLRVISIRIDRPQNAAHESRRCWLMVSSHEHRRPSAKRLLGSRNPYSLRWIADGRGNVRNILARLARDLAPSDTRFP